MDKFWKQSSTFASKEILYIGHLVPKKHNRQEIVNEPVMR